MCLKVEGKTRFKKAKKEITCYKVLRDHGDKIYSAPFHMMLVSLGKEYHTGEEMEKKVLKNGDFLIRGNAFHSFKKKEDAIANAEKYNKENKDEKFKYIVVSCLIPEGSEIIEGTFRECDGICSNVIKYEKTVD